jgi:hypothetical protein
LQESNLAAEVAILDDIDPDRGVEQNRAAVSAGVRVIEG